jgi:hypothetical protein
MKNFLINKWPVFKEKMNFVNLFKSHLIKTGINPKSPDFLKIPHK